MGGQRLGWRRGLEFCALGLACWLGQGHCLGVAAETEAWNDARLAAYLAGAGGTEAVLIRQLDVRQGARTLLLYNQTGNEEQNRNLRRRPILAPARPEGPFVRGTRLVARVDRSQDIEISAGLELITRGAAGAVRRTPVPQVRVWVRPSSHREREFTPLRQGVLRLSIPRQYHCSRVDVEIFSGDERHRLSLSFLSEKAPVTLESGPTP